MINLLDYIENLAKTTKEGGICSSKNKIQELKDRIQYLRTHEFRDSAIWVADTEKRLLGIALSTKRIEVYGDSRITHFCSDFLTARPNNIMCFGVDVDECREWVTASGASQGQKRADVLISDSTGKLKGKVWADVYIKYSNLLVAGNSVIVSGERGFGKWNEFFIIKEVYQP